MTTISEAQNVREAVEPSRLAIVKPSRAAAAEPPTNHEEAGRGLRDGSWRSLRDGSAARQVTRGRRRHWWRELIYDEWFWATQAWERQAEAVALGYATELAEYAKEHPRPQLKTYMIELSPRRAAECAEIAA